MPTFLQQLRVDWPAVSEKAPTEALRNRTIAELSPARDAGTLPPDTLGRVCLKELMEERGRPAGYDPNVDSCLGRPGILAGPESRDAAPRHPPAPRTPRPASAVCSLPSVGGSAFFAGRAAGGCAGWGRGQVPRPG